MSEALAMALLVSAQGVGYVRRSELLALAGSAANALGDPRAYVGVLGEEGVRALENALRGADELEQALAREGVRVLTADDAAYPPLLKSIRRPPHALFVQGEADLADSCTLAVVGTRRAGEYGLRHTHRIARELAEAGACVVSGLAMGVDAAAHSGALDGHGRTVAVLGGALDRFYPAANRLLRERILENGGSVVSEFPMGMSPTKYSFLLRNRIVAGMSLGVLVTQGAHRSGALRTANDALDEGREVFALPGSVDSALSQLPHKLIADGARVATCAKDILDVLVLEPAQRAEKGKKGATDETRDGTPAARNAQRAARDETSTAQSKTDASGERTGEASGTASLADTPFAEAHAPSDIPAGLSAPERAVLRALSQGVMDFDALCVATGMPSDNLGGLLTLMEMDGHIESLPGLRYARV